MTRWQRQARVPHNPNGQLAVMIDGVLFGTWMVHEDGRHVEQIAQFVRSYLLALTSPKGHVRIYAIQHPTLPIEQTVRPYVWGVPS